MRKAISHFGNCAAMLLFLGLLNGCQTASRLPASHAMPELSPEASNAIAHDMTAGLTSYVPVDRTVQLKRDRSRFAAALETSLTEMGYGVAPADAEGSGYVQLAYVIEQFDGQVLARLATGAVDLGRTYTLTRSGASPASPFSVKQHR